MQLRAAHQEVRGELADFSLVLQRLGTAKVQIEDAGDAFAFRLLHEIGGFNGPCHAAFDARLDILRRRDKVLPFRYCGLPGIAREQRVQFCRGCNRGSDRLLVRNERADGEVGIDEIGVGDTFDVRHGHLLQLVAIPKQQTPIAHGDILAQIGRRIHEPLVIVELIAARPIEFVLREILGTHGLNDGVQLTANRLKIALLRHHHRHHQEPRVVQGFEFGTGRHGELGLHQALV